MKIKCILICYMINICVLQLTVYSHSARGMRATRRISYERQVRHATYSGLDHKFVSMADVAADSEDRILPASSGKLLGSSRI